MPKTGSPPAGCWPGFFAEMAAAPAAASVLTDMLWCLGLGCLLAALRQLWELALGRGALRCFLGDILAFASAAVLVCGFSAGVSASGTVRWYMAAAMLAGAVSWRWAVQPALYNALRAAAALLAWPAVQAHRRLVGPLAAAGGRAVRRCLPRRRKIMREKQKNEKKQLQKQSRVLYN